MRKYLPPILLFVFYMGASAGLGLSDDEAYYWVLAQRPAWGYAYHPPAVAWVVAFFQWLLGWVSPGPQEWLVRLPAAVLSATTFALALSWTRLQPGEKPAPEWTLLSLTGFALSAWMMVPDVPMFASAMALYVLTWKCIEADHAIDWKSVVGVALCAAFAILSKYNAILFVFSSAMAALLLSRSLLNRKRLILSLAAGTALALVPIVAWNASHEWVAIAYQFKARHGGEWSFARWIRFALAQVFLIGPFFMLGGVLLWRRARNGNRSARYALFWALPSLAVFCLQPLFSDFKLHWSLAGWIWIAVGLGAFPAASISERRLLRLQRAWALLLALFFFAALRLPVVPWVAKAFGVEHFEPKWDVTNDFYGWREFAATKPDLRAPIVGLRYQTAAQAAFVFGRRVPASLHPLGIRDRDEWPNILLTRTDAEGREHLIRPVYVVGDYRYDQAPTFYGASCEPLPEYTAQRFSFPSRTIMLWFCAPQK